MRYLKGESGWPFKIPVYSETVVDVLIDRVESDDNDRSAHYVIAPTEYF